MGATTEPGRVLRLTFLWGDSVVDSFAFRTGETIHHALVKGGALKAEWDDELGVVVLTLDECDVCEVAPGGSTSLAGGVTVRCQPDQAVPHAQRPILLDGRWLHALMIAAALQVCAVSALLLTPSRVIDPEAGGGLQLDGAERFLAVPAGGATTLSTSPVFAVHGDVPREAERLDPALVKARAPDPLRPRISFALPPAPTVEEALEELTGNTNHNNVDRLRRAVGADARWTAESEAKAAALGGLLSPRELVEPGESSGEVGLGKSDMADRLRQQDEQLENTIARRARSLRDIPPAQRLFPASPMTVPSGEVRMDPLVREFIAARVKENANTIRYCYETFGLAAQPKASGTLTLEMTLLSSGYVADLSATADANVLEPVARCVEREAASWYLGDVLPAKPQRVSFPFHLVPKKDVEHYEFDDLHFRAGP